MAYRFVVLLLGLSILCVSPIIAEEWSMETQGQVSLIHAQSFKAGFKDSPTTIRYIPELRLDQQVKAELRLGLDVALDLYNYSLGDSLTEMDVNFYRLGLRYDSPATQVRIGLQKINFGPARMLRVLQWFDQVDVRDPLALSPGVWAGLGHHYFENGVDLRLWMMADAPNQWRNVAGSQDEWPWDLGARLEVPMPKGTLGMTIHQLDLTEVSGISETRTAADIRFDAIIGLWSETMLSHVQLPGSQMDMVTIMAGLDYTFGIGNGLYVAVEGLTSFAGAFDDTLDWQVRSVALMSNYSLGLSDALVAYVYTMETPAMDRKIIPMLGWNHTQGNWLFYLAIYDMPQLAQIASLTLPTGTGVQFNVAYSH